MSDHDTKQDYPGAEWIRTAPGAFIHPILGLCVRYGMGEIEVRSVFAYQGDGYRLPGTDPVEACRAISAAALAWESTKADRGLKELIAKLEQIERALPALRLLKELAQ